jgi:glucose/arabinose dehydrogenase
MKLTKLIIIVGFGLSAALMTPAGLSAQSVVSPARVVATEDSTAASFRVVQLVSGLDHPWAFAFMPDGSVLVTERAGRLYRYDGRDITEIDGLPDIDPNGQGGLLDVILHPNYDRNGWIYLSHSTRYGLGLGTAVSRGRLQGDTLVDVEEVFRMNDPSFGGRHFGSRLAFGADQMLYITIGDRGDRDRAQDTGDHAGTVIRIRADGRVPEDNPFVGTDALPEIYSFGHRNAQGMALHPETGEIWLHEHGPQGGDEINVVRPGANYGWPLVSYGGEYGTGRQVGEGTSKPGIEEPLLYWTPSIAPSGMAFYTEDAFRGWTGDLFVGALAGQHLRRVDLDGGRIVGEEVLLQRTVGRIRDVRQGPDGNLYLITDEDNGGLYRIEPM